MLLVDDIQDIREFLTTVLEMNGATLIAVASVTEALKALEQHFRDADLADTQRLIVISDIGMPDEDGYTLIRRIRALASEQGGDVPAIALTAYATEKDKAQALSAGFQAHLAKPVDPDTLVAAVLQVVQLK